MVAEVRCALKRLPLPAGLRQILVFLVAMCSLYCQTLEFWDVIPNPIGLEYFVSILFLQGVICL